MSDQERWARRSTDEVRYWRDALNAPDARSRFADRLDPRQEVTAPALLRALDEVDADPVRVLDVGSGPLTSVGKAHRGRRVDVVPADPLAREYVALLRESPLEAPVLPVDCRGEDLAAKFPAGSFDVTFAQNSLDHSVDPLRVLDSMVTVTKPDGRVVLTHLRNEGERNGYMGIHVWNIDVEGGRLVLWNLSERHDVSALIAERFDSECWTADGDRVHCLLRPRA